MQSLGAYQWDYDEAQGVPEHVCVCSTQSNAMVSDLPSTQVHSLKDTLKA